MLNKVPFIEYPEEFHPEYRTEETSPIFRRRFEVKQGLKRAALAVCGLGYGYYYLNGEAVTDDLFTAPTSDYNKTLWYNIYDVTDKLTVGENLFAVILGNGFYNETLNTTWCNNGASWRGLPKFALKLELEYEDTTEILTSDEAWLCSKNSPVLFNQLRSGETYDSRIGEVWRYSDFNDSDWVSARQAEKKPSGVLRECLCQPIREDREYVPQNIFKNSSGNWVIDFGQNISGYVRVDLCKPEGTTVLLRHTERLKEDGTCEFNEMDSTIFYRGCEFQVDRVICNGESISWKPRFTYHGFRYIEVEGLDERPEPQEFTAVFVHQDIKAVSEFNCSDNTLNKLFYMGQMSTWSNLFYILTDCPTREKMGWTNDAQASCEQILQNFDSYKMFRKWLQDIFDAVREDGALPGIIPTHGWGYEWGSGPISSGVIFELVYMMYRYSGNIELVETAFPYMLRHLAFVNSKTDLSDGLIGYGLCDWAGPFPSSNHAPTPVKLSDTLLAIKFHRITAFAADVLGKRDISKKLREQEATLISAFKKAYVDENGRCKVSEQTAIAMMIALGVYDELKPLKAQLCEEIEKYNYHHHCGMLGLQYLFNALDICGLSEYGYRIITADGHPSYKQWITDGATTMYERWGDRDSNNHHMFSCILAWFNKTLVGLRLDDTVNAYRQAVIAPIFIPQLDYCSGSYDTAAGKYSVYWKRNEDGTVTLEVNIPEGAQATVKLSEYQTLDRGESSFTLPAGSYSFVCGREVK